MSVCCREGPDRGPEVGVARAAGGHAAQLPRHGAGAGISTQLSTNISTIIYNMYRRTSPTSGSWCRPSRRGWASPRTSSTTSTPPCPPSCPSPPPAVSRPHNHLMMTSWCPHDDLIMTSKDSAWAEDYSSPSSPCCHYGGCCHGSRFSVSVSRSNQSCKWGRVGCAVFCAVFC